MLYKNYTDSAILELERQRTDNYAYDVDEHDDLECCECNTHSQPVYNINSKQYCSDCICELLREIYSEIGNDVDKYNIGAFNILRDIISDFSDSELLCYVDNLYDKIN